MSLQRIKNVTSISMRIGIAKHNILKSNMNNNCLHLIINPNVTQKTKIITFRVLKNEHCILRFRFFLPIFFVSKLTEQML